MNIKNIKIPQGAALAPMAGVTDRAFREICAELGAAYFTSEMVSVKGVIYGSKKTLELIAHSPKENPFALQLFGSQPKDFEKAINLLENHLNSVQVIDINMGCPATKIVKENSGSALMKAPELCAEIIFAAKKVSPVPVTIKIRSGWDDDIINAPQVAKICEQAGADAVTVHGRTKKQGYSGTCNLDIIKSVKQEVFIPVIGNGDITSLQSARHMISYTGCNMVAIGRAAMGNPWIFREIQLGKTYVPTACEKAEIMKSHIQKLCFYKGEDRGIKEARKHIAAYIKGTEGAAELRRLAFETQNKNELLNICEKISY